MFKQRKTTQHQAPGESTSGFLTSPYRLQLPTRSEDHASNLPRAGRGSMKMTAARGVGFCEAYAMCNKKNVNIIYNLYVRKRYETVALSLFIVEREATQLGEWRGCSYRGLVYFKPFMSLQVRCDWFCLKDRVIGFVILGNFTEAMEVLYLTNLTTTNINGGGYRESSLKFIQILQCLDSGR